MLSIKKPIFSYISKWFKLSFYVAGIFSRIMFLETVYSYDPPLYGASPKISEN